MIPFNKPPVTGQELNFISEAIAGDKLAGGGIFAERCQRWFEDQLGACKTLLTPSCTHALEMAAMLIDIKPGDEVIMPSYTFVSTANAFVLRGAKIIFVDIRPDTMNIDESLIEAAITERTKAIVPVHYAGVGCDMDSIMQLANRHNLVVVEDAAQGMMSSYQGKPLGSIGHIGAFSFHETKNYTSGGEGGLLILNDPKYVERAEILREKGTNRSKFFRGMVDKYSWVDVGSSYLPSEIQAAYLWAQLESAEGINHDRLANWARYATQLQPLAERRHLELPVIPVEAVHNAHMFYIKVRDVETRATLIDWLKERGVMAVFHYVPLHSAHAGKTFGALSGTDTYTTLESERLIRLPLWFGMPEQDVELVVTQINQFFEIRA